jgi:hypothetical protein
MRRYVDYGIGPWKAYEFDGDLAVVIEIFNDTAAGGRPDESAP